MKNRDKKILIILNPSSGVISKDLTTSFIFKKLRRHFETVSIINTNSPQHVREISQDAFPYFDIITAFGGDGTINSIACNLLHSNKVLGILPGGSGNGLVRNLGIPLSWKKALDVLVDGRDITIDAGMINEIVFFNVAGIGLDGLISKKFNQESKSRGIFPYIYFALKGYFEAPAYEIEIITADYLQTDRILITAFANFKQYGGKAIIAPYASPQDQLLDLCILQPFNLFASTLSIQRLFSGQIDRFSFYKTIKFEKITIKSRSGLIPFHFDGEYGGYESNYFEVKIIPQCLRVRVPQESEWR